MRGAWMVMAALVLGVAPAAAVVEDPAKARNEYGISVALRGSLARAESVFTAVLSGSPRDARALNNLGNVYFLRGEMDLALAFYNRAMKGDTADAGVRLNRATVWLMSGDEERASSEAAEGLRRAGGEARAAEILGLPAEAPAPAAKAAESAWLSRGEVRAMLARAASRAPKVDSAVARQARAEEKKSRKPNWRSAGPRGAEGTDAAAVLYWKR